MLANDKLLVSDLLINDEVMFDLSRMVSKHSGHIGPWRT